jgi:deoxyadenosine/deoxycytidine kinase
VETNQYIVVEGNIGAGKTSFVSRLAIDLKARLILEQYADNPFLPKFYQNPERYSFPLELSFLAARYKQLAGELAQPDLFTPVTIADYYFAKSLIFARNTLHDDEFNLYRQLFDIIWQQLPLPTLYVYLNSPVERLLKNIKLRGRDYEQGVSADYLLKIQQGYFDFFKTVKSFPVVVVNVEDVDFVKSDQDYLMIKSLIGNQYSNGINYI